KVGTMNPGVSQQVFRLQPFWGAPGGLPQPGMPVQAALGLPHLMQAVWLHVGGESAAAAVDGGWMPGGDGDGRPSAVAHGVWGQVPDCPPQSASLLQNPSALLVELVMQTFGPGTPRSW